MIPWHIQQTRRGFVWLMELISFPFTMIMVTDREYIFCVAVSHTLQDIYIIN
jgi:hypothetical protein